MTALELLERLNLLDENERIEAKSASEVGKSLLETVCAFANEPGLGGGWLLLGVAREELSLFPAYEVQGIEQPDKISADLASQATSVFNRPLRLEIQTESLNDQAVIAVFVPEAAPQDKPIFLKAQGLPRGAFRRIGSTDQRCTEDDLLLLYQGRQTESFDAGLLPDGTLDDFSPEAIEDYRQSRREANPDAEELRWNDHDLLQALGAIRLNEKGQWQPTVAGLLLFGKPVALRRSFPMTRVDYIRVPGREWVPDPERRFDSIELRDPLFRLIRRVQAAILDDLPKSFGLTEGDLQRQDSPVVPQRVIREAVVNALMHRSYRSHAPVQIIRYSNRLEIRNPGFSLKSPEHLGEPGSLPRNPKLAAALYDTRFAETKGSGVRVMREMCEQAGLAPPLFESDRSNDSFVIRLFFHHFLGAQDLAWLGQFKALQLTEAEARALVVAREAGALDNATWREINRVDTLTASHGLKKLRDAGLLQQNGKGSATWYQPTALMMGQDSNPDTLSSNPDTLSSNPDTLSSNPPGLSSNPDSASELARRALLNELQGELAARIGSLGKRGTPEDIQEVVVALCRYRSYRAEELAQLLARNIETVRQSYLRPLLRDGRIRMTRPEKPNDPEQAYRTVQGGEA
ncbi:ATP-dependent DNA helicase RecG [Lampropedia hyalina DSM 16112]|jgi:ATP-dependent DNA helicase RecG|uniref:ATP-dependent DNA helicase RecG n=1 Tax=Lampropedia hyalina DSM 16112 TaxID=1122156 RepID=A0A1M4SB43_9BURK|nr:ATP-binding protein [Lampropedia hyalina]SHE29267.1 ATP-dependent DNA helicase RecG [Lampropedia hyalina DSM 16112]